MYIYTVYSIYQKAKSRLCTYKPEPDSLSQDNPEVYSVHLTQVSEVQRDQSVIPVTAYHSWFVKPKRDKRTEYYTFYATS